MPTLTTTQAAARLGVTQSTIRYMCLDGRLKARRLGRDWLIEEEDLQAVVKPPKPRRRNKPVA